MVSVSSSSSSSVSSDDSSVESEDLVEDQRVINPDTFEDFFVDDENYWLSEDHLFELQTAKDAGMKVPPALSTWEEIQPTAVVDVTVGKARRLLWDQGKAEINLHRNNVERLPIAGASSNIDKVYQYLFGSKSKVCRLFTEKLGISSAEYLQFLVSYLKSCRYKMSIGNLHDTDDTIPMLMETKRYNEIWQTIATLTRHAHGESFWQELESLLNTIYKELFMEAGTSTVTNEDISTFLYMIGLDDDKLHYNYNKNTKTDGLKKDHHAKDNRSVFNAVFDSPEGTSEPCVTTSEELLEGVSCFRTAVSATVYHDGELTPEEFAVIRSSLESALSGLDVEGLQSANGDIAIPTELQRASVTQESVTTSGKVGFSMGMVGVVLVTLAAMKVILGRDRRVVEKGFDDDDDDTFVYPSEEDLVGSEFDLELENDLPGRPSAFQHAPSVARSTYSFDMRSISTSDVDNGNRCC